MYVLLRRVFDGIKKDSVLLNHSPFLIGTAKDCHLRPLRPLVSRYQCQIEIDERSVLVRNLANRNLTMVNGQRVAGFQELHSGDRLQLGLACYEVLLLEAAVDRKKNIAKAASLRRLLRQRPWKVTLPMPAYAQRASR